MFEPSSTFLSFECKTIVVARDLEMVPEARVELARLSTTVFETAASAIPPLGRNLRLYPKD